MEDNLINNISLNGNSICATTNTGSSITIDPSWLSTSTGYSYSYGDTYSFGSLSDGKAVKETVKEEIEKYLDSEDEMMPIVKNYLRKYLEKVMDNPEEIIKEVLKEKDQEIEKLKEEVANLKKMIEELDNRLWGWSPIVPLGNDGSTITTTSPYITWIGGSDSSTSAGDYSASTSSV